MIRHSTLTNMGWGTHGVEIDYQRGKNAFELYGNTFIATEASFTFCADRGSGAGLIYDNHFIEYLSGAGVGTCEDQLDNDGDGAADDGDSTCATWWDPATHRMRGYTPLAYPHPLR